MIRFALLAVSLVMVSGQDDPFTQFKTLSKDKAPELGRVLLCQALEKETAAGMQAVIDLKSDECESRLLKAAQLSRPYLEDHAKRLAHIVLSLRRTVRAEGTRLVTGVSADIAQKKPEAAAARINEARSNALFKQGYGKEIERLVEWLKVPPDAAAVEAELARWRVAMPRPATSGCATCKGIGEMDCPVCLNGLVAQSCRPCTGKGQVTCMMCSEGSGMQHSAYQGKLRIILDRDFVVRTKLDNGKTVEVKYYPQTLVWTMQPCHGGSIGLRTVSTAKDPKHADKTENVTLTCPQVFEQFQRFVFNGKAKVWLGDDPSKAKVLTVDGAKRIFGDYEKCQGGRIPCTQCAGKKLQACPPCNGRGSRPAPCSDCGGAQATVCTTCMMCGDTAWVSDLVPPTSIPELAMNLHRHAGELTRWESDRALALASLDQMKMRLDELKKGVDAKAQVGSDAVTLPCPTCKGSGGTCGDCWGTGRRQYVEGTAEFARYAAIRRLELQLGDSARRIATVPALALDFGHRPTPTQAPERPPVDVMPEPPPVRPADLPGIGSGVGGTIDKLPAEIQALLKKAEEQYNAGKVSLEKSKTTDSTEIWAVEARKAIDAFRDAQKLLTQVQETLDLKGIDTPAEVLERVRNNMQALVMARKQAP